MGDVACMELGDVLLVADELADMTEALSVAAEPYTAVVLSAATTSVGVVLEVKTLVGEVYKVRVDMLVVLSLKEVILVVERSRESKDTAAVERNPWEDLAGKLVAEDSNGGGPAVEGVLYRQGEVVVVEKEHMAAAEEVMTHDEVGA